jgi:hypothetical protein
MSRANDDDNYHPIVVLVDLDGNKNIPIIPMNLISKKFIPRYNALEKNELASVLRALWKRGQDSVCRVLR